jgi:DNA-binding PadR family transcriptional regulator
MKHVDEAAGADHRPLSEQVFWILVGLAGQPRHGYALIRDVERLSDGRVRLTTGTLYTALARLLEDSSIEQVTLADTSREKRSYRLTAMGRRRLKRELARLEHASRAAGIRLRAREA